MKKFHELYLGHKLSLGESAVNSCRSFRFSSLLGEALRFISDPCMDWHHLLGSTSGAVQVLGAVLSARWKIGAEIGEHPLTSLQILQTLLVASFSLSVQQRWWSLPGEVVKSGNQGLQTLSKVLHRACTVTSWSNTVYSHGAMCVCHLGAQAQGHIVPVWLHHRYQWSHFRNCLTLKTREPIL